MSSAIRGLFERLGRGSLIRRRLPRDFGRTKLFVSPDAQLKYLKPGAEAFDMALLKVVRHFIRTDSVVWDIGANVGVFTFAAASLARNGHVLAIEPDIWLASIIRRSCKLNPALNIDVLPAAVGGNIGVEELLIGAAAGHLTR